MLNMIERVCVMGLGYVGLPTATLIASRGIEVIGVDKKPEVVKTINEGNIHIVEPDLDGLVAKVVKEKKLQAYKDAKPADIFIITVPTPITGDKKPDMTYVEAATKEIAQHLDYRNLVIIESTSPVGTTQAACEQLAALRPDLTFPHQAGDESDIRVAYCPERILPGDVLHELTHNDRTIGGITQTCAMRAAEFYSLFVRGECHLTNAATAELVKLSENAYRDVNIAYANELANICAHHGLDESEVIRCANLHPRVNILRSGVGVGGHCIPVDPWFIVDRAPRHSPLIKAARSINDARPAKIAQMVTKAASKLESPSIACLGLAYKPDIDDLRESPAMEVVENLLNKAKKGTKLYLAESHITAPPEQFADYINIHFTDALSAITAADIVVTLVNHRAFHFINKHAMDGKVLFDCAGVWKQ